MKYQNARLKECKLDAMDDAKTVQILFGSMTEMHARYIYALYVDGDEPKLIESGCCADEEFIRARVEKSWLPAWLEFLQPDSIWDWAMALDSYYLAWMTSQDGNEEECLKKISTIGATDDPVVDAILQDSRNLLLWAHQLENLYRAFGAGPDDITKFRKNINQRESEAYAEANLCFFSNGLSLYDVIREHTIGELVVLPNLKGAKLLYSLFR